MITVSVKHVGAPSLPVLAPAPAPCRHGGTDADIIERCPSCNGGAKHVRECEVQPNRKCTWEPVNPDIMDCARCRREGLGYEAEGASPPAASPAAAEERARFVAEFRAEVERAKSLPYPDGRFSGRGVVIPAGGWRMLPGVFVTASLLRWAHVNSRLPVEVWYVGDEGEFDPIFEHITADLGVTWRNVSDELRRLGIDRRERLHGWAVKPLALLLSSFEQVVMMDFDCYPAYDPERLWDDPRIGGKPAAFWPDNPGHTAGRPLTADQWEAFGLPPAQTPGFESGQMLVDKRRSWAAVNVAAFLSDRMDYFDATREDRGRVKIHGDKEIFSLAWNATGTPYHMGPPVKYHEVAFLQHDPDGHVAFVHRCNDKPKLALAEWKHTPQKTAGSSVNFRSTTLHHDHRVHFHIDELRELLRPTLPGFRDGTQDEQLWREVRVQNAYRLPKRMDGMRVVDVGAHAGFFTHECCRRGAALVVAAEPYFPNLIYARENLAPWTRKVKLVEAAVVAAPNLTPTVEMRGSSDASLTGEPCVAGLKGLPGNLTVRTTTLDELIELAGGTVDLLKIDAEGSEYPALLTAKRLAGVKAVAGEFHTVGLSHHPRELRAALEAAGFVVEMDESLPIGMFFAVRPGAGAYRE